MNALLSAMNWLYPIFQGILIGLLAMIIHECGHLMAARLLGINVKSVSLRWKGLCTIRESGPPIANLLISLAGPAANALMLVTTHWSPVFGLANACYAFFNFLPIEGADGERALACWSLIKGRRTTAT